MNRMNKFKEKQYQEIILLIKKLLRNNHVP